MSISYSDEFPLPSGSEMKSICRGGGDCLLFFEGANTLFASVTALVFVLFIIPMVIAAPVGMICGTTFWSGDCFAIEAWLRSAMVLAPTVGAVVVGLAVLIRYCTRSYFGAPAFESELQVDLAPKEAWKLVRSFLKAQSVDGTFYTNRAECRQIALMGEGRFSNTYLEISMSALEDDRTWIMFRSASIMHHYAGLIGSFFTDFGCSRESVKMMMDVLQPFASSGKVHQAVRRPSKQAMAVVRILDQPPPPQHWGSASRQGQECINGEIQQLKACG